MLRRGHSDRLVARKEAEDGDGGSGLRFSQLLGIGGPWGIALGIVVAAVGSAVIAHAGGYAEEKGRAAGRDDDNREAESKA